MTQKTPNPPESGDESRIGQLASFSAEEGSGWIEGPNEELFFFSKSDVISQTEIGIGDEVSFVGADGLASRVRKASEQKPEKDAKTPQAAEESVSKQPPPLPLKPDTKPEAVIAEFPAHITVGKASDGPAAAKTLKMKGKLVSYEQRQRSGWIQGEDSRLYLFSDDELLSRAWIIIGDTVSFSAHGKTAKNVSLLSHREANHSESELPASADKTETPARAAGAKRSIRPKFRHKKTKRSAVIKLGVLASLLFSLGLILYLKNQGEPSTTAEPERVVAVDPDAVNHLTVREAETDLSLEDGQSDGLRQGPYELLPEEKHSDGMTGTSTSTGADAPQPAAESAEFKLPPSQSIERTKVIARVPAAEPEVPIEQDALAEAAHSVSAEQSAGPGDLVRLTPEPVKTVSTKPESAVPPGSQATLSPASAKGEIRRWWPEQPVPGALNLLFAGHLAGGHAIVLAFDGVFSGEQDFAQNILVVREDGSTVPPRWKIGPNATTLILAVEPGRYGVSLRQGLSDAEGKTLSTSLGGALRIQ